MSLITAVAGLSGNPVLLQSTRCSFSSEDIIRERLEVLDFLESMSGRSVGLHFSDNLDLALWLMFLDGVAARLVIMHQSADIDTMQRFAEEAKIATILTDSVSIPNAFQNVVNVRSIRRAPAIPQRQGASESYYDTEWVLSTSGTTSKPKLVSHRLSSLSHTVKQGSREHVPKFVWGLLYDLTRFAGVQVFLQSVLCGNTLVIPVRGDDLAQKIEIFREQKVDCLSATPTLWRKILMLGEGAVLDLKVITLGGEISDQMILDALKLKYPNAKVRHIYASTESGTGFSVSDGMAGFPEAYLTSPPPGMEIAISTDGTLLLKSKANSNGYIASSKMLFNENGFVDTGDLIEKNSSRFLFKGRANGTINIGGNKVQPELVEQLITQHESVELAVVFSKPNPITGSILHAHITTREANDHREITKKVRKFCSEKLERHMVPSLIKVVDEIPVNEAGKVIRK